MSHISEVRQSEERGFTSSLRTNASADKPTNIGYVTKNDLCVGCGVCEVACPSDAIQIVWQTRKGMPVAVVNETKCTGCQMCLDVCYGYRVDSSLGLRIFRKRSASIMGNVMSCRTGYANDQKLRYSSSSGGAITALLIYALRKGLIESAIVTRMEPGNPPKPRSFIATTVKEVLLAQGSKYCPVSSAEPLKRLENGMSCAVVGLPCHLYGIRKLAEFNTRIRNSVKLYFGLLCGGMPSYFGTSYILRNYKVEKKYVEKLEYRGGGWPGRLLVRAKQSSPYQQTNICVPYPAYWRDSFRFFFPLRCTLCHDCFNEFSDISFGDAWLPDLTRIDKRGTSLIVSRTEKGESLIEDASNAGVIWASFINAQDAIQSQPGLIRLKHLTLEARMNLCRGFRKKTPILDPDMKLAHNFSGYLSGIGLYVGRNIASKSALRPVFDFYVSANTLLGIIRGYVFGASTTA